MYSASPQNKKVTK